jgi:hypothetical protein
MSTVDYLPVAIGVGANVDSQANFAGSGYQQNGFTAGIALSLQLNKCWRQASMVAAAIANFISIQLGINVLDDGNLSLLYTNFTNAILNLSGPKLIPVAYALAQAFISASNPIVTFETTLTGNVTSSTLSGVVAGQQVNWIIHQDGAGGRTFAWPSAVSASAGVVDPTPNATSVQAFLVDGSLNLHPLGAMTSS